MNKLIATFILSAFAGASFASTPNPAPATDKAAPKAEAKAEAKADAKKAAAPEKAAVKKEEANK